MKTHDRNLGYLQIDHRNSPGLTEEFLRTKANIPGKPAPMAIGSKLFEADTYRCPHCHGVVLKNPLRERPRNYCRSCDAYTCDNPACNAGCLPKEKLMDVAESAAYKARESHFNRVQKAIDDLRRDILGQP